MRIEYGCPALARAVVGSGRIGNSNTRSRSNYTNNPTVTVFHTGNTLDVTVDARINNGVLPQPIPVTNFGTGYFRSSAEISAGDGFAEIAPKIRYIDFRRN